MLELFIYIFDLLQIAPDFTPDIWSNLDYLPEALVRNMHRYDAYVEIS